MPAKSMAPGLTTMYYIFSTKGHTDLFLTLHVTTETFGIAVIN